MIPKLAALRSRVAPLEAAWKRSAAGRRLSRFPPAFILWSGYTILFTFAVVVLVARIFFLGTHLSGHAIEAGQRVLIEVASGEVEGNARHTKAETPPSAPTPAPAQPVSSTPTSSGQAGAAPPAPDTAPNPAYAPQKPVAAREGLAPAPLESISTQTDKGLVPMVSKDGMLPWKYYARPYKPASARPMVAVILTEMGLSKPLTNQALALPHAITLSFSPYASDARKWAESARGEGFETLVDLPMQTVGYRISGADPGPYGLLEATPTADASARLRWVLSRFPGFVGVLAPENDALSGNSSVIRPTLIELAAHGVLFLYIKTPRNEPLAELSHSQHYYALGIDKVIDSDIALGPVEKQLDDLAALAKTQGYAIGFAHAYPPVLQALPDWAAALDAQGVDLVPVSAIATKVLP